MVLRLRDESRAFLDRVDQNSNKVIVYNLIIHMTNSPKFHRSFPIIINLVSLLLYGVFHKETTNNNC